MSSSPKVRVFPRSVLAARKALNLEDLDRYQTGERVCATDKGLIGPFQIWPSGTKGRIPELLCWQGRSDFESEYDIGSIPISGA